MKEKESHDGKTVSHTRIPTIFREIPRNGVIMKPFRDALQRILKTFHGGCWGASDRNERGIPGMTDHVFFTSADMNLSNSNQ